MLEWPVVRTMGWLGFTGLFVLVMGFIWAAITFPVVASIGGGIMALLYFGGFAYTAWCTIRDNRRLKRARQLHAQPLRPHDRSSE